MGSSSFAAFFFHGLNIRVLFLPLLLLHLGGDSGGVQGDPFLSDFQQKQQSQSQGGGGGLLIPGSPGIPASFGPSSIHAPASPPFDEPTVMRASFIDFTPPPGSLVLVGMANNAMVLQNPAFIVRATPATPVTEANWLFQKISTKAPKMHQRKPKEYPVATIQMLPDHEQAAPFEWNLNKTTSTTAPSNTTSTSIVENTTANPMGPMRGMGDNNNFGFPPPAPEVVGNGGQMGEEWMQLVSTTVTPAPAIQARTSTRTPWHRRPCRDEDMNCYTWVAKEPAKCADDDYLLKHCRRACDLCGTLDAPIEEHYSLKRVPRQLQNVAFLIGRWRSDFGGKADFPTIPRFTYGERLDFSLVNVSGTTMLNYTAFAWDNSDFTELHSESGFLMGAEQEEKGDPQKGTGEVEGNSSTPRMVVALNTVMSNGFVTVERGEERDNSIRFQLERIGRINFSRDLPVRKMIREWTLLNATHMEARLHMGTQTHRMLLHTQVIYEREWP